MRVLEMAAKQKNCAQANFDLYTIYKNGTNGVQPDLEKASQYLDAAAKSNFAEALSIKAQALEDAGDWKGAFAIYSDIAKNGCHDSQMRPRPARHCGSEQARRDERARSP